jgi:hypothetical protein
MCPCVCCVYEICLLGPGGLSSWPLVSSLERVLIYVDGQVAEHRGAAHAAGTIYRTRSLAQLWRSPGTTYEFRNIGQLLERSCTMSLPRNAFANHVSGANPDMPSTAYSGK